MPGYYLLSLRDPKQKGPADAGPFVTGEHRATAVVGATPASPASPDQSSLMPFFELSRRFASLASNSDMQLSCFTIAHTR